MRNSSRRVLVALVALLFVVSLALLGCGKTQQKPAEEEAAQTSETTSADDRSAEEATTSDSEAASLEFYDPEGDYKLQQVVVLSRHNIRAPLSTNGSALALASSHEWIDWTANGSELTSRGGTLETMNGEYFRKWLEHEELAPENWQPDEGAVRFYANAKQRTQATARYFAGGFLPVSDVDVEMHVEYDTMDPVFTPQITYLTDAYEEAALAQVAELNGKAGMEGIAADLADSYQLISDVCGYTESDGYKDGTYADFDTNDTGISYEMGKEPAMTGSLKTACQLSDALVLQYYEAATTKDAAFGADLTIDQWKLISKSKDRYNDVLFSAPLVAVNLAHPLLAEIGSELDTEGRQFSFLCGHDSNIASVLGALGVKAYELPGSIEAGTPIGSKLVFEKWTDADGKLYGRVRLVYQNADQLRSGSMLSGYEAPMSVELDFEGLEKNDDGLFAYEELRAHIADAADAYDELPDTYGEAEEELAPAA